MSTMKNTSTAEIASAIVFASSNGRVMMKMMSNTNAKSNSGVMLISFRVTSELR